MPNLIASTAVPGAPMAMNHPMQVLPVNVPQIAEPAQPIVQSRLRPLLFPPAAQPEVAAPPEAPARRVMPSLPIEGAIVVPPAPDVTARRPDALQLPAQAPPQVAAPSPETATSHALQSIPLSMAAPQVAPPAPAKALARESLPPARRGIPALPPARKLQSMTPQIAARRRISMFLLRRQKSQAIPWSLPPRLPLRDRWRPIRPSPRMTALILASLERAGIIPCGSACRTSLHPREAGAFALPS
jgi:hypothetical protein